jgi:hypothetical protein
MPTRYTKRGEIQQMQYEIANEIKRDAEPIAQGVFGNNARHPDMATVSNPELDQIFRDAYARNDRQWLMQEAQRDPQQFLDVTDRLGIPDPPTDMHGQPTGVDPNALEKALQNAAQAGPSPPPGVAGMSAPPPASAAPMPAALPPPAPPLPSQIPQPGAAPGPTVAQPVPMQSGGIVTQPTVALIGEAGPEAVVPLGQQLTPLQSTAQLTDPDVRARTLRDAGWTEDAIQKVLSVPVSMGDTGQNPTLYGRYEGPFQTFGTTLPLPGNQGDITLNQQSIAADVGNPNVAVGPIGSVPVTPETVYTHEAHHAFDVLTPAIAAGLANHGQNAATVLNDLNTVRQYAAVQHNAQLYDATNAAMAATSNDPAHVNHYMLYAAGIQGAPEWYLAKYFPFLRGTPQWTGAEAQSAPLEVTSPRLHGNPA